MWWFNEIGLGYLLQLGFIKSLISITLSEAREGASPQYVHWRGMALSSVNNRYFTVIREFILVILMVMFITSSQKPSKCSSPWNGQGESCTMQGLHWGKDLMVYIFNFENLGEHQIIVRRFFPIKLLSFDSQHLLLYIIKTNSDQDTR